MFQKHIKNRLTKILYLFFDNVIFGVWDLQEIHLQRPRLNVLPNLTHLQQKHFQLNHLHKIVA